MAVTDGRGDLHREGLAVIYLQLVTAAPLELIGGDGHRRRFRTRKNRELLDVSGRHHHPLRGMLGPELNDERGHHHQSRGPRHPRQRASRDGRERPPRRLLEEEMAADRRHTVGQMTSDNQDVNEHPPLRPPARAVDIVDNFIFFFGILLYCIKVMHVLEPTNNSVTILLLR